LVLRMEFKNFIEASDVYESIVDDCASIIVDKKISPNALNELADIYLEFNPLALAGGLGGAALAGPVGALAGGMAGQRAGQSVGNWFKKGQAAKIEPAFQQAKSAVGNLVQAITSASQTVPQAQSLLQNAQNMQQSLQQVEPQVAPVDQELAQQHDTQAHQAGGIAQKLQGVQNQGVFGKMARGIGKSLGKMDMFNKKGGVRGAIADTGDKMKAWAKKHPNLAKGLQAGGAVALGSALGSAMAPGTPDVGVGDAAAGAGATVPDAGSNWTPADQEIYSKVADQQAADQVGWALPDQETGAIDPDSPEAPDYGTGAEGLHNRMKARQAYWNSGSGPQSGVVTSPQDLGLTPDQGASLQQAADANVQALQNNQSLKQQFLRGELTPQQYFQQQQPAARRF
jgi:hypothetical protein